MASGIMREPVVSSPQPAITLQTGSAIDESQKSSCCDEKSDSFGNKNDNVKSAGINYCTNGSGTSQCGICSALFATSLDLERHMSLHESEKAENKGDKPRKNEKNENFVCCNCKGVFTTEEQRHHHLDSCRFDKKDDDDCSNHSEDCLTSNNGTESNTSTNSTGSPKSSEFQSTCTESDESFREQVKGSKGGRRFATEENKGKGDDVDGDIEEEEIGRKDRVNSGKTKSRSESDAASRRKLKTLNNNNVYNHNNNNNNSSSQFSCPACERNFSTWNSLQNHLENSHPDYEMKCEWCNLTFDSPRVLNLHRFMAHNFQEDGKQPLSSNSTSRKPETRKKLNFEQLSGRGKTDRKSLRNLPKIIGFQDINFIDFSSEKFPLIAKDICEKSLHLARDDFARFECRHCGRGFPCNTSLQIHVDSCESNEKKSLPKIFEKKNKRKSTPKFHPQQSAGFDSDDGLNGAEISLSEQQRTEFFKSLDLKNREKSPTKDMTDEERNLSGRGDTKTDLADIQSILSVANIPALNVKTLAGTADTKCKSFGDDKSSGALNVHVNNCRSSPESFHSSLSMSSPNFNVLNLISPNYSGNDLTEEEAQDCFAAECRRMKLRGEFPCKLCTAIFPNLRALKGHNRVHISVANGTSTSPYRCNICTYNSLDKATLVRHMRSHNGDRPYECAMCNYAFTTKANCERHLRNRHSKITRDEVKSSIIYHPSEDPINDAEYQKTNEMNKRNLEKSKEKPEFSLPMNLKINLSNLKDGSKGEDLFQAEHQELIKNIKNEEHRKTEAGTMTEDVESENYNDWHYENVEEALDLRICKGKTYESDSDIPQDLSKTKEDIKEFNNNIEEKSKVPGEKSEAYLNSTFDNFGKSSLDISNLVKIYSNMYPSLNVAQIHQIILTQLNFPGILSKFHNFPFSPFMMSSPLFPPPPPSTGNYLQKNAQKDVVGLQLSGGNILDEKNHHGLSMSEKLQIFQQQALAEIIFKREKDRFASEYFEKNTSEIIGGDNSGKSKRFSDYFSNDSPERKSLNDILLSRRDEKKENMKITSSSEKAVDSRNSSVKMVIKNGILIPKQKQRRYRTERPFSCEHCSARFTLRSNMERHIKQQHPQYWTQKSRSNIGNLKKTESAPIKANSSYDGDFDSNVNTDFLKRYDMNDVNKTVSLAKGDTAKGNLSISGREIKWESSLKYGSNNFSKEKMKNLEENVKVEEEIVKSEEEYAEINEQKEEENDQDDEGEDTIKGKLVINENKLTDDATSKSSCREEKSYGISINPSKYLNVKEKKVDADEGKGEICRESQPQDLASVSKMLDNAVTQTQAFQKYFQESLKKEDEMRRDQEDAVRKEEGDRSEEEEGLVAGSTSSDENRSESEVSSKSGKKKSAYSLAPNRVSCPYCFRKFPWTSSLRRHVLTHTGQKPFKCTHCPLLFTTKSNCDRHLLRKHGREALLASSGQTENPESTGPPTVASGPNQTQNSNYPMRNVPERPYKCNQCPSSTFSTLSNLNKHLFSKHNGQMPRSAEATIEVAAEGKSKTLNSQAPPNVTVPSTFALGHSHAFSVAPQFGDEFSRKFSGKSFGSSGKNMSGNSPCSRPAADSIACNGIDKESLPEGSRRLLRKRSSSDEIDAVERKKTSPEVKIVTHDGHESDGHRSEPLPAPSGELAFKCHLCDSSFGERSDALEHIRCQHPNEFRLLMSKGALETNTDEEKHGHDEGEEVIDSTRGRFPDYANRKVMCAFCMRRFWSAEDLRRHMRTHTGERPFSCDVCQRRFTLKHSMLRHRKKHSAHDEVLVGSDEEHHNSYQVNHNNNISVAVADLQKPREFAEEIQRTILHQTLTRCDEVKDDL